MRILAQWRRGRDLNSRSPYEDSGFQDRHVRPLRHPSILCLMKIGDCMIPPSNWISPFRDYSLLILSCPPMYGRNASGITIEPSGC